MFPSTKPPMGLRSCLQWIFGVHDCFLAVGGTRETFLPLRLTGFYLAVTFRGGSLPSWCSLWGWPPTLRRTPCPTSSPAEPPSARCSLLQPEEPPGRGRPPLCGSPRCPPHANIPRQQEVTGLRTTRGRAPPAQRARAALRPRRSAPGTGQQLRDGTAAPGQPLRAPARSLQLARCRSTCAPGKVSAFTRERRSRLAALLPRGCPAALPPRPRPGAALCGVERNGAVRSGAELWGAVPCGACGAVRGGSVRVGAERCGAALCGAVRIGADRCGAVRWGAVRWGAERGTRRFPGCSPSLLPPRGGAAAAQPAREDWMGS